MEKNMTVTYHYCIVVDVKLQWSLFCVKNHEELEPVAICKGKFMAQKMELKNVKGVHLVGHKLIVIFDPFYVAYLYLPEDVK